MNLKKECKHVLDLFIMNDKKKRGEVYSILLDISRYFNDMHLTEKTLSLFDINELVELEYAIMNGKGYGKNDAENHILDALYFTIASNSLIRYSEDKKIQSENEKIVKLLVEFVEKIFAFKKERDGFASKRKMKCLSILRELTFDYEIPKALELAIICLESKKDILILGALEFFDTTMGKYENLFTSEFIEKLDKIISKTKSRSIIVGALDLQVSFGNISEFEALDRLDDWKEKYLY